MFLHLLYFHPNPSQQCIFVLFFLSIQLIFHYLIQNCQDLKVLQDLNFLIFIIITAAAAAPAVTTTITTTATNPTDPIIIKLFTIRIMLKILNHQFYFLYLQSVFYHFFILDPLFFFPQKLLLEVDAIICIWPFNVYYLMWVCIHKTHICRRPITFLILATFQVIYSQGIKYISL